MFTQNAVFSSVTKVSLTPINIMEMVSTQHTADAGQRQDVISLQGKWDDAVPQYYTAER